VAPRYDLMNDLMSLGLHRIWKRLTVALIDLPEQGRVLDLAGGTADLTALIAKKMAKKTGEIILSDINAEMLALGRNKLIDQGLWHQVKIVQADAENLPFFDNEFDAVTIAFGLRNVTDKDKALQEIYRTLKPGGEVFILEFSELKTEFLKPFYDAYSFKILPKLGEWIAGDAASYQYLAESIRRHPNQGALLAMLEKTGFAQCRVNNFLGGVVALHRGFKL
jgi:demethylmenaquinone methyltransferase/2-methoxy-6-polyprenyl-1,4-benzoquinol methylase